MPRDSDLFIRLLKPILYRRVERPSDRTLLDVPYVSESTDKQCLNFFLPDAEVADWATIVFVHGGGWTGGDRNLLVAGEDVYNNIGRFLASKGFGCAVISYRLLPDVHWRDQFADVASAVAWAQSNCAGFGGRRECTVLAGHSAGAHLAARSALDTDLLRKVGGIPESIRGVVSLSGAGFDMADEETYRLGADIDYLRDRFADETSDWQEEASVTPFIEEVPPPFLIMHGSLEEPGYARQAELLGDRLRAKSGTAYVIAARGQTHQRIIPAVTRSGSQVSDLVLNFVRAVSVGGDLGYREPNFVRRLRQLSRFDPTRPRRTRSQPTFSPTRQ